MIVIRMMMAAKTENLSFRVNGLTRVQYRASDAISLTAIESTHAHLLYPLPHIQTYGKPLREPLFGVTALVTHKPIGLILCENNQGGNARIVCWNVLPRYCNKGIGSKLLFRLEKILSARDAQFLTHSIRNDLPSYHAVEYILSRHGWSANEVLRYYKVTRSSFSEPAWFRQLKVPKGYSIFSWSELLPTDKKQMLRRQSIKEWFPKELTPFQQESTIEWSNSLGLRFKNEVVGWLITHRVGVDVIQYTSLFVSPEHRTLATGFMLIIESVRRHKATDVNRAIFQVRSYNKFMLKLINRRFSHVISESAQNILFKKEI